MSELQLSDELLQELQHTVTKFDERAMDPGIAVQYLAAAMGYMVALQPGDYEEKNTFLNHLQQFAQHVFDDVSPPPQEAFGVWRPGSE